MKLFQNRNGEEIKVLQNKNFPKKTYNLNIEDQNADVYNHFSE
jgi:hypothetical protein